jgi:hypothetical protein
MVKKVKDLKLSKKVIKSIKFARKRIESGSFIGEEDARKILDF